MRFGWKLLRTRSVSKLLLSLVLVVLIPMLAMQAGVYYVWYQSQVQHEQGENLDLARSLALAVDTFVRDVEGEEQAIGSTLVKAPSLTPQAVHEVLAASRNQYASVRDFHWVSPAGEIIASSEPNAVGMTLEGREYFRLLADGNDRVVSELVVSLLSGRKVFAIGRRINDANGTMAGAAIGIVEPAKLNAIVMSLQHRESGTLRLFDSQGRPLLSTGQGGDDMDWRTFDPLLTQAFNNRLEQTGFITAPFEGRQRLAARVPLASTHWVAGSTRLMDEVVAPILHSLGIVVLLMLLVAAASLVGGVYFTRRFVRPIRLLQERVRQIGLEDLDPSPVNTNIAELQDLSGGLEQAAGALRQGRSAERQAVEALRLSEERFRLLFSGMTEGFALHEILCDQTGEPVDYRFLELNPAFERLTGLTREQALGRRVKEVLPGTEDVWIKTYGKVALTGEPVHFENYSAALDKHYEVYAYSPARGQFAVIFLDVTERKRSEQKLKQTAADLARSNRDLEQFAYVASHDLQEPLRMVSGFVQLLERRYKDQLDQNANEFIAFAVDGVTRMQQLINDLLTFSRVGTRGGEPAPMDMGKALDQVVATLQEPILQSGAAVTHDPLPTVRADMTQMVQLLQNLIANALKFCPADRTPQVHVTAADRGSEWEFCVCDNGIGIDSAYLERIFRIFQRLHTQQEYPGTGIGLAICKRIIERHGGRIWAASQAGQGSKFCFTLPK